MKSKKIIFFSINMHGGGAERQILQLLRYWPDRESLPILVLMENQGVFLSSLPEYVRIVTLSQRMPELFLLKVLWFVFTLVRFLKLLVREKPQTVLTFLWQSALSAAIANFFSLQKVRLVWSVQDDLDFELKTKQFGLLRRLIVHKFLVKATNYFVPISRGIASQLTALKVADDKMQWIPNSVDLTELSSLHSRQSIVLSKKFSIRIITAGRLVTQKGFDVLLDAFRQLNDLPVELIILGTGPGRNDLEKIASEMSVRNKVNFPGFSADIYAWFKSADIFVSSSRWESFGLVILEAMACGLPVVCTDTDGARDLVFPGKNGLLVPREDGSALSDALRQVVLNAELRLRMGDESRYLAADFSAEKVVQKYYQVLA